MYDFTNDPNPVGLSRHLNSFPAWMDEVEFPTAAELSGLSKTAFADPDGRLHPVHTKAACISTAAYLTGLDDVSDHVVQNVKRAAAIHGVQEEVDKFLEGVKKASSEEAADEHADAFALAEGEHKFYPVGTTFDINLSMRGWKDDVLSNRLLMTHARKAACVIAARAVAESVEIDPFLQDWSNDGPPDTELISKQARARGMVYPAEDEKAEVEAMYRDVLTAYQTNPTEDFRVKAAETFEHLDKHLGIRPSALVLPPHMLWFGGGSTTKKASGASFDLKGETLPIIALSSVPLSSILPSFTSSNADTVKKAHAAAVDGKGDEVTAALSQLCSSSTARFAQVLASYHSR